MKLSKKKSWPFFEYEEGVEIQIKYVGDGKGQAFYNQCTKVSWKKGKQKEETDTVELRRKICNEAIVGWKFKREKLPLLIEPRDYDLEDGDTWKDDFLFDGENKDMILEELNGEFGEWVVGMSKDVTRHEIARKAQEKRNLETGSASKEAEKN